MIALKQGVDACTEPETKAALQEEYDKKAEKLGKRNQAYNDFCEENGLKRYDDRLAVGRWDREQARDAIIAEKKSVAKSAKSGTMVPGDEHMAVDVEIDALTPCLRDTETGELVDTSYTLASVAERTGLKKKGWAFNWNHASLRQSEVYKITVKGDDVIQGLVAMEERRDSLAVHLSLAESAPHNRGEGKKYEGVGGHLFAIATKKSFDAGYGGFVFFEAKNMDLVNYYTKAFGATLIGMPHQYSMIIDEEAAAKLLDTYTL